jgi:hypothetical protein
MASSALRLPRGGPGAGQSDTRAVPPNPVAQVNLRCTFTRGHPISPMPHRAEGRLLLLRLDGLLAALAGCFAHFPHGTFALSGSEVEI